MHFITDTLSTIYSYFLKFYSAVEPAYYFYCVNFVFFLLAFLIIAVLTEIYFNMHRIKRTSNFLWHVTKAILAGYIIFIFFAYFEFNLYDEEILPEGDNDIFHISRKFPIVNYLAFLYIYSFIFLFYLFFLFNYVYDLLIDYFQQNYEIIIFFFHIFFFFFLFFSFYILLDYYSYIINDFFSLTDFHHYGDGEFTFIDPKKFNMELQEVRQKFI